MVRRKQHKKVIELVEGEGRRKSGVILGVDVHKTVLAYCFGSETRIVKEDTIGNTKEGIQQLIGYCRRLQVQSVGMESTAQYHFKLLYALLDAQIPVLLANPRQTKETQGKKTDKLDARRIYLAHRDGRLKPSVISPAETLHLRKAMRQLVKLTHDETKIKQRLQQFFHQKEFRLMEEFPNLLKTQWGLQVMRRFLDAEVQVVVEQFYPKQQQAQKVALITRELRSLKANLDTIEQITLRTDVAQLIMLENLSDQLRLVYVQVAQANEAFRAMMKLLMSIPGVGPDTAAEVLAELVDISYFQTPAKLVKWAGLAPRVHQSGHRKRVTGKIYKGGNKYLRRALTLACQNIYAKGNNTNPLWNFIKSKYQNPKQDPFRRAICAGARKLLTIIWFLLKRNQEWRWQLTDESVLQQLKTKIQRKITGFQHMITKYQKTQEMLDQEMNTLLDLSLYRGQNPKLLLKALLGSV
jgi:transposase